jgi:hypothetical protein
MHEHKADEGVNLKSNENTYLEDAPQGTPMDSQHLSQRIFNQGVVVPKLLPQHLLGLGLVEMGRRRASVAQLLLRVRDDNVRGGRGSM